MPTNQPKIIAITNQKGGVGKTTTAINLAAALAERGKTILLVDLDPQGNASTGLGVGPAKREKTTYDVLVHNDAVLDCIYETSLDGIDLIPATTDLSSADIELAQNSKRVTQLSTAFAGLAQTGGGYDFVFIDCPPSLNLLTVNALVAADSVLIPLQSEFFALEGLSQLLLSVRDVRSSANPDLRIEGVVLTMYDARNNLSQQVEQDARDNLGELVYQTVIPRNVRISEAPSFAMPVLTYDGASKGSMAYRALAGELLAQAADNTETGGTE